MDKNEQRSPQDRTVSFGKYIGKKFGDLPTNYLVRMSQYFHLPNIKKSVKYKLG